MIIELTSRGMNTYGVYQTRRIVVRFAQKDLYLGLGIFGVELLIAVGWVVHMAKQLRMKSIGQKYGQKEFDIWIPVKPMQKRMLTHYESIIKRRICFCITSQYRAVPYDLLMYRCSRINHFCLNDIEIFSKD